MFYRFSNKFGVLFFSRIVGGFGSGVIFILVPIYMKELYIGENYNGSIVDLLITQFGFGIFSQYFIGEYVYATAGGAFWLRFQLISSEIDLEKLRQ